MTTDKADSRTRHFSRRDSSWDWMVADAVNEAGFGVDTWLWGLDNEAHADEARRGLRRGGEHLGVAVKALWHQCQGCDAGGPEPHCDLVFQVYPPEAAREYMKAKAERLGWPKRGRQTP